MAESTATAVSSPRPLKVITGADSFGRPLKDALVSHLRSLNIEVEDLGTSSYYSIAAEVGRRVSAAATATSSPEIRGLLACATGCGVSIFANKFPGVYASICLTTGDAINTRSINNSNVLAVAGISTTTQTAVEILDAWLNTPFKAPCPVSNFAPWSQTLASFLDESLIEMRKIGGNEEPGPELKSLIEMRKIGGNEEPEPELKKEETLTPCALCCLMKNRKLDRIDEIPGGSMKIVRQSPTSAMVKFEFEAGSVEPAHHHTFGHDLVVMKGSKRVWNLSEKIKYDLNVGDYLFTPAGDVHRVKYFEDTEFFIKWEGKWDILFDEQLDDHQNFTIRTIRLHECKERIGR